MWNQRNLSAPPLVTLKSSLPAREITEIRKGLEEAKSCLSLDALGPPAARISRLIMRLSNQFRSTIGFKAIRKMNIALLRAREINLPSCMENILACFPTYLGGIGGSVMLPSRQYIEYTLIKLMGFAKVLCRIVHLAKEVAKFFLGTLNLGHFLELSTIVLATVAEIWKCSRNLCKNTALMYNRILTMRKHFVPSEQDFLKGYHLPQLLDKWLGSDWDEITEEQSPFTQKKSQATLLNFSDDEDEAPAKLPDQPIPMEIITVDAEETGIAIDRRTFSTHTHHSVIDRKSLLKFLQYENQLRTKKDPKSLTENISAKKWQKFQEKLDAASRTKSKSDLLTFFRSKWKKILPENT
uniref:Nucleolus and neural progenitor protein-like N-terminal domain-containing protein n=1 Tax=Nyssomyia neivai TaxID=330878 RepID=A0A1L8DA90_9DIPT